ncbi:MAG: hypothetical protein AAB371_01045 [Patescibacteria group bacterium]
MASTITISKKQVIKDSGVVVLPLKEYERLVRNSVPTYYLEGKEAEELDKLVEEGLKEYKKGKTKTIKSLSELD